MKYVYPTDRIPHLWAHQTQESARNPQGNLYFRGDTIYSYRDSFPAARLIEHKGEKAVLINADRYSSTTGGHLSDIRRATSHLTSFTVGNPRATPKECLDYHKRLIAEASKQLAESKNKISRAKRYRILCECIEEHNRFAAFFGLKSRVAVPVESEAVKVAQDALKRENARLERKRKQREKEMRKREAEAWAENAKNIIKWRAGENVRLYRFSDTPTMLRLKRDVVETSMGAEFPVAHAVKVLPIIKRLLERGEEWHRNGQEIRLGHYYLDSISADGTITAGCHVVPKDEVLRLIKLLEDRADANLQEMAFAAEWR